MTWKAPAPWVWWAFAVAAAAYAVTFAVVVVSRVRDDRRRRLLAEVKAWLDGTRESAASPETRRKRALDCLAKAPARLVERLAADTPGAGDLPRLLAEALLDRTGHEEWTALARRGENRRARWRRALALRVLALARPEKAGPLLDEALRGSDDEVRSAAVALLGQLPDRWAADLLVATLINDPRARSRVATALETSPVDVSDLLVGLLADPQAMVRYWAAVLLRRHPDASGLEAALEALSEDPKPAVRKAALGTLSVAGGASALRAARRALSDPVPFVRAHAARALGTLHDRDSVAAIVSLLADRNWYVRLAAKESLEAMGPDTAPVLVGSLDHPDAFARNGVAEVLHHFGAFERLLTEEAAGPTDAGRRRVLAQLARGGSVHMWDAAFERLAPAARDRARALLREFGVEPVSRPVG